MSNNIVERLREWVKENPDLSPDFAADILYAADVIDSIGEHPLPILSDYL